MRHLRKDEIDDIPHYQFRRTFEDTLRNQTKLKIFIKGKIKKNYPVFIFEEDSFEGLIARSFLSQGNWRQMYYEDNGGKIPLGPAHTFAISLSKVKSYKVDIHRFSFKKQVDIAELWQLLLDELSFIFPGALEEALRISGEGESGVSSSGYSFDGDRKID